MLSKLFKKQTIISLTLILSIVAITMYSSYASLFKIDPVSIAKAHETDNLRITFGNNGYDQQFHSQVLTSFKDEEALVSKNIKSNNIYITNNADYDIRYKLFLKNVLPDESILVNKYKEKSLLDSKYIKYQINNLKPKSLNEDNLIFIDNVSPGLDNNKKIEIKIWVSDEAKLILSEKQIHLKFLIEEIPQNSFGEDNSLANIILSKNGGVDIISKKTTPNFDNTAINNEGIFYTKDDLGNSFYFRGSVNNNIIFGKDINNKNLEWKIVRINGDKSIRIILNENMTINYPSLLSSYNDIDVIESWYNQNIKATIFDQSVVKGVFCDYQNLSLLCINEFEKNPSGLLTKNEAIMAGSSYSVNNSLFYLSTKNDEWLYYSDNNPNYYYLSRGKVLFSQNNNLKKLLRPVINIKGNLIVKSGDGSLLSPYILDLQFIEEQ